MWGPARVVALVAPVLLAVAMFGIASLSTGDPADRKDEGRHADVGRVSRSGELVWWCLVGAAVASIALCVAVTAALAPGWVVPWLAMVALATPPVRARIARHLHFSEGAGCRSTPGPDESDSSTEASSGPAGPGRARAMVGSGCLDARIADLDTTELCHLWRVTFWMVRDMRSPMRTANVVDLRKAVLDELERRRPDAVARWLNSGRHGADGPARYL